MHFMVHIESNNSIHRNNVLDDVSSVVLCPIKSQTSLVKIEGRRPIRFFYLNTMSGKWRWLELIWKSMEGRMI